MNQSSSGSSQAESTGRESDFALRSRNHYRAAAIVGGTFTAIFLYFILFLVPLNGAGLAAPTAASAALMIMAVMSTGLNWRGHLTAASWLLIGGLLLIGPVTATAVSGIGLTLGAATSIAAVQTASQTLDNARIRRAIAAGVAAAFLTILIDQLWVGERATITQAAFFVPAAAVIMVLANGYFVARRYGEFSIRTKLISSTFVMTAIALGATIFFVSRNTSAILTQNVGHDLRSLANSQALAVGELLGRQTALLELLSQNQILQSKARAANAEVAADLSQDRARIERLEARWSEGTDSDNLIRDILDQDASLELNGFLATFPTHMEAYLTDASGALLASTHRIPDYYHADDAWWQAAFDGGRGAVFVGSPRFDGRLDATVIQMAVPMRDLVTRDVIGILRTTYGLRDMTELLASVDLGKEGHLELLLPSNEFYDARTGELEELAPETLALLHKSRAEKFSEMVLEDERSLVSQAPVNTLGHVPPIDALGWTVVVHQLRAESLAVVTQQQRTLILIGVTILGVITTAAAIVANTLTGSITRLIDVAKKAEAGDLSVRAEVESGDEVGQLAGVFNNITHQLQKMLATLERQVIDRTRALEASTEVSRSLSAMLDREQLVSEVVERIRSAFGYYHAHIYLFDESNRTLVMVGGTGDAGRALLGSGHKVQLGTGLVGRAFADKAVVFAADVSQDSSWLPNPLLPETKSEIAVPITIGDQVLGVLDVQQNVVNGLTAQDAQLLQSVAGQMAIALRNARIFAQAHQQAERQALINEISQKIRGADTIDDVLRIATTELGRALPVQRAGVEMRVGEFGPNGKSQNG